MNDDFGEDFDDDIIEECNQLETEALSQLPSKSSNVSIVTENSHSLRILGRARDKSLTKMKNKDHGNFPSFSNFNHKVHNTNLSNNLKQNLSTVANKNFTPLQFKENNIKQQGTCTDIVSNILNKDSEPYSKTQIEILQKENSAYKNENYIKQGEILNLRSELKRKNNASDTERIDHCLALDAAEKRGREKVVKQLSESEKKVKELKVELDKYYGSVVFQNKEIEELKKENRHLQQKKIISTSPKKINLSSPRSKKLNREFPVDSDFSSSFIENFKDKKKLKDVHVQTCDMQLSKRPIVSTSSVKGKPLKNRRSKFLTSMEHSSSTEMKEQNHLREVFHLLERDTVIGPMKNGSSENDILKSICLHLEGIAQNVPSISKHRADCTNLELKEPLEYYRHVSPLFNAILLIRSSEPHLLQRTISALCKHISPLKYKEVILNINNRSLPIEAVTTLLDRCSILPLPLCTALRDSLSEQLQNVSVTLASQILAKLTKINNFRAIICTKCDDCFLQKVVSIMKPDLDHESRLYFLAMTSQLLEMDSHWLQHTCSNSLLKSIISIFYHQVSHLEDEYTWNSILTGLQVLQRWVSVDPQWWGRGASVQNYSAVLGPVIRRCSELKKENRLPPQIWDLLFELHDMNHYEEL